VALVWGTGLCLLSIFGYIPGSLACVLGPRLCLSVLVLIAQRDWACLLVPPWRTGLCHMVPVDMAQRAWQPLCF
jgi:hypothetical protein